MILINIAIFLTIAAIFIYVYKPKSKSDAWLFGLTIPIAVYLFVSALYRLFVYPDAETSYLWTTAQSGAYNTGDVFSVKNAKGDTIYLQWTGSGFRQVTEDYYYQNEENGWVVEYHKDDKEKKVHIYKQG